MARFDARFVMTSPDNSRLVGGVYQIERRLGVGAMGSVYRAKHAVTGGAVALKVLHPHLCEGNVNIARFKREVGVSARVGHEGIVQVYDAGLDPKDGSLFVAMELLEGTGLEHRLRRPKTRLTDVVRLLKEMCEALEAAHARGIVHRDLKPDNVFVRTRPDGQEQVKLLDFGIARDLAERGMTATHSGIGTPAFMPPEQAVSARKVGPAADVWAVGVMLYWYASGRMPFEGDGSFDTVLRAMTEPHIPLTEREAPAALIEVVESCLKKTADDRPASAGKVAEALDRLLTESAAQLDRRLPPASRLLGAAPTGGGSLTEALFERARVVSHGRDEPSLPPPPTALVTPAPTRPPRWPVVAAIAIVVGTLGSLAAWKLMGPSAVAEVAPVAVDVPAVVTPPPAAAELTAMTSSVTELPLPEGDPVPEAEPEEVVETSSEARARERRARRAAMREQMRAERARIERVQAERAARVSALRATDEDEAAETTGEGPTAAEAPVDAGEAPASEAPSVDAGRAAAPDRGAPASIKVQPSPADRRTEAGASDAGTSSSESERKPNVDDFSTF